MEQFIKPELLADNCHSHHKEDVSRHFTEEEIDAQVSKFDSVGIACLQKGE